MSLEVRRPFNARSVSVSLLRTPRSGNQSRPTLLRFIFLRFLRFRRYIRSEILPDPGIPLFVFFYGDSIVRRLYLVEFALERSSTSLIGPTMCLLYYDCIAWLPIRLRSQGRRKNEES